MPDTWTHPRLGVLEYDGVFWERMIVLPSLDSFTYIDVVVRKYQSTHDPFELRFEFDSEEERPTEEMASLALTVIDNEPQLMPKVLDAIWSDLIGRGPDSGMWWHGDLPNSSSWASAVHEILTKLELPVPTCAGDLKNILEPKYLTIRRDRSPAKPWVAELNFHAGFDVEHGVGVLTDGVEILGIGYSSDATRFETDSFDGRWSAKSTSSSNSQIKFDDNGEPDPQGVSDWLNGFDPALKSDAQPTSGLFLTIDMARGAFTERVAGKPAIEWFDAEGILAQDVTPFDGTIVCNSQGAYLRPKNLFELGIPVEGRYGNAILRYDDGDTKIADNLRLDGELLIRTVNVVTDELYLNRVIIVYERMPTD